MKKRIILSVFFVIAVLTLIVMAVDLIGELTREWYEPTDGNLILAAFFFLVFPVFIEELILMRSIYNLVIFSPHGAVRICNIVAAFLIICALTFQILYFTGIITEDIFPPGPAAPSSKLAMTVLLTEWPVMIISFILISVREKAKE